MSTGKISLPRYIAARYISAGKRSHLVSFMSAISVAGLTLGIAVLIIVLSVMNGFDKEMRENVLGIVPHITLSTNEVLRQDNWNDVEALVLENPRVESISPL
jgi:ABC-type transport system, involved in lipoprotei n release, permease component